MSELQALLDKQAITEVLYRYCRANDRLDEAELRGCFDPSATVRHGPYRGTAADFFSLVVKIVGPLKGCKHMLTNVLIELDGDSAFSESHYFAYHRRVDRKTAAETDYFSGGRYLDRWRREVDRWLIVERVGLIDFERFDPPGGPELPAEQRGRKYPDDDLYSVFHINRRS